MRYVKPMIGVAAVVFSLMLLGLPVEQAEAQVACCRILSVGTAIAAESFGCDTSGAQTRKIPGSVADFEVDYTPVSADIRSFVRLATLDTQVGGGAVGQIFVADRSNDFSKVFVRTANSTGVAQALGFNLCLF